MKIIPILLGLCIAAPSFAQEVVVVQDEKRDYYALVTTCKDRGKPVRVRVPNPQVGEVVYIRTARDRQKCEIKKVVKVT